MLWLMLGNIAVAQMGTGPTVLTPLGSAGQHGLFGGAQLWYRSCTQAPCFLASTQLVTRRDPIPGGAIQSSVLQATASADWAFSPATVEVHFAVGGGLQLLNGGNANQVWMLQPGLSPMVSMSFPVSTLRIELQAISFVHWHGVDPSLSLTVAWE